MTDIVRALGWYWAAVTPVTHRPCASVSDLMLTPMTHQPCASTSDPMWVQTHHNRYVQVDRVGWDQEWTTNRTEWFAPSDIIFDFQHMYISRRGDNQLFSMSFQSPSLVSLRPWQSEHQRHTLHPPHHHTLTPTGYLTTLFRTWYPSDIKCDSSQVVLRGGMRRCGGRTASVSPPVTTYFQARSTGLHASSRGRRASYDVSQDWFTDWGTCTVPPTAGLYTWGTWNIVWYRDVSE